MKSASASRFSVVDALRGIAIVLMAGYHFCFDLDYYGLIRVDFNHAPFWLAARSLILSLFLGVAGISLILANPKTINRHAQLRRLGLIAGCSALVSMGSYVLFPASWIFFGVLHFIAVASVLGLLFLRSHWFNLVAGIAILAAGTSVSFPLFDQPALQWVGLMTHKPFTEDYVPLLPWFGVVLIGMFWGRFLLDARWPESMRAWQPRTGAGRALVLAGRHSLIIYMLHQPLLLGLSYFVLLMQR